MCRSPLPGRLTAALTARPSQLPALEACGQWRPRLARKLRLPAPGGLILLAAGLLGGCQSDSLRPAAVKQPQELYWSLDLNHHAVLMSTTAPYDTLTLTAVPRNYHGNALAGLPTPTYSSSNPDLVAVTPDGKLHALKPTAGFSAVRITAKLTADTLTHIDDVLVEVVDNPTPPRLASFSIHPVPPDSAKVASSENVAGNGFILLFQLFSGLANFITAHAIDSTGAALTGLPIDYRASDPTILQDFISIDDVTLRDSVLSRASRPGTVQVYASTTAFGITKADTVTLQVGWPLLSGITVFGAARGGGFDASEIRIGTGGMVVWNTDLHAADTAEIVFSDPTNVAPVVAPTADSLNAPLYPLFCDPSSFVVRFLVKRQNDAAPVNALNCTGSGNFTLEPGPHFTAPDQPALYAPAGVARRFPVPGTYEYQNVRTGARGRIIVVDER